MPTVDSLRRSVERMEGNQDHVDQEALACYLDAFGQYEVTDVQERYGAELEALFSQGVAEGEKIPMTDEQEAAFDALLDGIEDAKFRLGEERGVSRDRINNAEYLHSKKGRR